MSEIERDTVPSADETARPPGEPVLELKGVTVRYGPVTAVDDVDLLVPDRGSVALLGLNGAGKSSMLAAISGLVPHDGAILLDGAPLGRHSPQSIARSGVAHVPEGRRLFPNLTVHENLQVSRTARGGRPSRFEPADIYDLFPALVPLRRRRAWSLSGGEQQMVAIGRALCGSPRVLLLDEPTLGLAPVVVDLLYDALTALRGEIALLLVEQATDLALELCEDAYVLRTGRVVLHRPTEALRERDDLMRSYVADA